MRMLSAVIIAVLLAGTAQADEMADQILKVHNDARAAVGVPPLVWRDGLANDAQGLADRLARLGTLAHSQLSERPNEGENLWLGTAGAFSGTQMAKAWADEKLDYTYGVFRGGMTADGRTIGHYTQMIWRNTTEIGCALGHGPKYDVLVCRYTPPGNYLGQKPY